MSSPDDARQEDEAFARRLFRPVFRKRVIHACWPIFPKALQREREEIIDQALQRAYEKRTLYHGQAEEDLLPWVLAIVKNLTRDILRSRKDHPLLKPLSDNLEDKKARLPKVTPENELGDEIPSNPLPVVAWEMTTGSLLKMLSEEDRDVLLLRLGHGLSVKETAEFLSVPDKAVSEAAVKMRLGRAVKRLTAIAQKLGMVKPGRPPSDDPSEESQNTDPEKE